MTIFNISKKILFIVFILILALNLGCSETFNRREKAIEAVKDNLTTDIVGSWKAVKYEAGYVVNFEDMAYWYVENGKVSHLNGFAKMYAKNTEAEYSIPFRDLF
ncbi:hypothetical protein ES702_02842 [subsurface metagenome]